jgi:hypothetical protein
MKLGTKYAFLGAPAKLQKARLFLSLYLSVCLHETTLLTIEGFLLNFTFEYFSNICPENSSFIKIGQE